MSKTKKEKGVSKDNRQTTMEASVNAIERPEVSPEEYASRELAKRIRKLRWMGMTEEAKRLQAALCRMPRVESVLLLPMDTD